MSVGTQRLRDDADRLRAGAIAKREDPTLVDVALAADASRRELSAKVDLLRSERKTISAEVGGVGFDRAKATRSREETDASPLRCPDPEAEARMMAKVDEARSNGDTVGGIFEVTVTGLPIGLGSHVHWDRKLDGMLAQAVMSINIVKGVEFGLGFDQTRLFGSAVHDIIDGRDAEGRWHHRSNNAGGLTGEIGRAHV